MKRFLFIITVLCAFITNAQTIHWLTFIDTTDKNVGAIDKNGRDVLYNHFVNVVNAALTEKGYKANIQDIYDTNLSPEKCKSIITNLNCQSNDIVVFYYIGHGTHGQPGGDIWPMMFMGQSNPNRLIPLKWVHEQLKSKGARLTVTIGMCCNVYQNIPRTSTPSFGVNYGNVYMTDTEKTAIQQMFLESKGDFLLSSASPGQSSLGGDTPLGPMDLFTCVLVKNFEDSASEGNLEWESLFNDVKIVVNNVTESEQTPVFVSNLTKVAPAPVATPNPEPVNIAPTQSPTQEEEVVSDSELLQAVSSALDKLIDTRLSESSRLHQANIIKSVFTSDAVVKVMSQDGNIVVDKSAATDFVDRLFTSRILLKVVPVGISLRNDKIASLKVKEIYKK